MVFSFISTYQQSSAIPHLLRHLSGWLIVLFCFRRIVANQINDLALWQGCKKQPISSLEYPHSTDNHTNTIESIIPYRYFDIEKDTITYDFGLGFIGFARVTLRGVRKGERIFIGNMEYICSGQLDEQACLRFTTMPVRKLTIYGDNKFRADHIVNVEGISIINN